MALTVVFCMMSLKGIITGSEYQTIFTVVVGFYFGTQYQKHSAQTAA